MANVDHPHGLRPLMRSWTGGPVQAVQFQKAAATGTAIFMNDAVYAGTANKIIPGRDNTVPFVGVALNYGAASTLTTHQVIADPFAVFECQDNDDSDGVAAADLGKNANIEANAGSATTKVSGHELDESTIAVTATLDLQMLGILDVPDNALGEHCRVEVIFNRHYFNKGREGV